jgi:PqqD family protein of HPr-rel-A system
MAEDTDQTHWSLVQQELLVWSDWPGDRVVFHGETGETHLIGELPWEILSLLRDGALDTAHMLRQWVGEPPSVGDLTSTILGVLNSLEAIELVERRPSARQ